METAKFVMSIVQVVICVVLILVVLFQSGKRTGLSGGIAGGAETFFGKNRGRTLDAKLEKATTFIAVAFIVCTLVLNLL